MSEFSLSFVVHQWCFIRVFNDLPNCLQYYVICGHVNGELCSFITVNNAKCIEVRYQQGKFFISFFSMKEGCMNIQLLHPSFGDV